MQMCYVESWKVAINTDLFRDKVARDFPIQFSTRNNVMYLQGKFDNA